MCRLGAGRPSAASVICTSPAPILDVSCIIPLPHLCKPVLLTFGGCIFITACVHL
jgi:hypothetical protein